MSLPTGITAGDLLFVFFGRDQSDTMTHPSGWWRHFDLLNGGARAIVYTRVADGSEGSTITATSTGADQSGHWSCRISNYSDSGDHFQMNTTSTEVSNGAADPPSLTPSGGAADYLWITGYHASGNDCDADVYPTNYSYLQFTQKYADGTLDEGGMAVAARQLNATTDNPSAFSMVTGNQRTPVTFTATISYLNQDAVLPWESAGEQVTGGWISRYRWATV